MGFAPVLTIAENDDRIEDSWVSKPADLLTDVLQQSSYVGIELLQMLVLAENLTSFAPLLTSSSIAL